jgi:ADP-ribosylglycohydrolase
MDNSESKVKVEILATVIVLQLLPLGHYAQASMTDARSQRIEGMLIGTLLGDAAGGPVEFMEPHQVQHVLPATRSWPEDRKLTQADIKKLADSFPLLSYKAFRPDPEPYAHWTANAPAGTITDDSRQKMILINTLRHTQQRDAFPVTCRDFARQYVEFINTPAVQTHGHYAKLCRENLSEYVKSAHWILGERNPEFALPPERMWAGVPTCAGQMALLPLATLYPDQPELAYRAAYQLGFIDNGTAKDLNAALVAGLAQALSLQADPSNAHMAWQTILQTMKDVDPYRYIDIPWVKRPITRWLEFAHNAAERANKSPKRLFTILETEAQPHYWWDAHFLIAVSFSILELCEFDPLASLHLALDFGHDTDSATQLMGAFIGALHGPDVFPEAMRKQVTQRLNIDYGESLSEWVDLLTSLPKEYNASSIIKL